MSDSDGSMGGVFAMSIVLIGLVLGAFVAVVHVKKRLVQPDDTTSTGFTLSDLRALHRSGQMTDAEFEKAKQVILVAAAKTMPTVARSSPVDRGLVDHNIKETRSGSSPGEIPSGEL